MAGCVSERMFVLVGALLLASPAMVRSDYTVTVSLVKQWNVWEGWGCSLAWWANVFGDRADLADMVFSLNYTNIGQYTLPGLGMNIARYNTGASSFNTVNGSKMVPSPNIPSWKQIEAFWLDPASDDPASSSFDWSKDALQRKMVEMARDRGANILQMFSNSPVWWQLYNHNPSGSPNGRTDNLMTSFHKQHAEYFAITTEYFKSKLNIDIDSVELFNEPSSAWWTATGTQEGCHFDASTQASLLPDLRKALDARGLQQVKISSSDETSYSLAISTWQSFPDSAKALVDEVNVHGYEYGSGRRDILYNLVSSDKKRLFNSEYGEGDDSGASLASNLNLDFQWLHMTGWCYWQPLDGGGWGLVQADLTKKTVGIVNPKYYVLAHYTRHIRPGHAIMDSSDGNTVISFSRGEKKLVLVAVNSGNAQKITFDLSGCGLSAQSSVVRWQTSMSTAGDKYVLYRDTTISGGKFTVAFDAHTIVTFEVSGVSGPGAPTVVLHHQDASETNGPGSAHDGTGARAGQDHVEEEAVAEEQHAV